MYYVDLQKFQNGETIRKWSEIYPANFQNTFVNLTIIHDQVLTYVLINTIYVQCSFKSKLNKTMLTNN